MESSCSAFPVSSATTRTSEVFPESGAPETMTSHPFCSASPIASIQGRCACSTTPGLKSDLKDCSLPSTKCPTCTFDDEMNGCGALDRNSLERLNTESNSVRADSLSESVRKRARYTVRRCSTG